jgi:hypothetical protein
LEADEKVKVYDRGVQMMSGEAVYQQLVSYRTGDMWSPNIEQIEALKVEASYFIDCIRNDKRPFNDGEAGLRIVRMLEAADESLKHKGKVVKVSRQLEPWKTNNETLHRNHLLERSSCYPRLLAFNLRGHACNGF